MLVAFNTQRPLDLTLLDHPSRSFQGGFAVDRNSGRSRSLGSV